MPAVLVLVATLPSVTGLPADEVQNVFHCGDPTVSPPDPTFFMDAVIDFYNDVPTGDTVPVGEWMSTSLDRGTNLARVDAYYQTDLTGVAPMGSPIGTTNFTLTAANNQSPLPEEVATVISYHGDLDAPVSMPNPSPPPATIRPQSRRRGRTYVGPLAVTTGVDLGTLFRPAPAWRTRLGRAIVDLKDDIDAITGGLYLGVWSRADAEVYPLVAGWVDDAWDVQRRRGLDATTRTGFSF
jgi:hypothetical protein